MHNDMKNEANKMFRIMLIFFNWSAKNYLHIFKVNGKSGRPLTNRQFGILIHIQDHNCNTISKLEEVIPVVSSTISNTVSKLVRDGYLCREYPEKEQDKRVVYFKLTNRGNETLNLVKNNIYSELKNFYLSLDENQQENFEIGIDKLILLFSSSEIREKQYLGGINR